MKLRVRIQRQTVRVDLTDADPSLTQLKNHIRDTILTTHGLSVETEFSLSLNGSEILSDSGQNLSACGIVSGDLICVILPENAANVNINNVNNVNNVSSNPVSNPLTVSNSNRTQNQPQGNSMSSNQDQMDDERPCSSSFGSSTPSPLTSDTLEQSESGILDPATTTALHPPSMSTWEPMLVGETEVDRAPLSLELLFHSAQVHSPTDAVMVTAHLLMMETGFITQNSALKEMPIGWRSGGVYRLNYTHPLCESSVAMVLAVCMGHMLVINATLKVNESVSTVQKLCLDPSDYVTDEWPGESAAAAYKDLNKLSRVFKDQLCYTLIATAREAMSLPVAFGLSVLPPELFFRIIRLLDVRSVVRLSAVCKHFKMAADDSTLWRLLYRRDFNDVDQSRPIDTDWKELYKRFYKLRSEVRLVSRHRSLPPFLPNHPREVFPPNFPLLIPGIIGGGYDQHPGILPPPHRGLLPPHRGPLPPRFNPLNPMNRGRHSGGRRDDIRRGFI